MENQLDVSQRSERRGRNRSPEQWRRVVEEFRASGLRREEFCQEHGIGYQRFCRLLSRVERGEKGGVSGFQEFKLSQRALTGAERYEVEVGNAVVIRIPGSFREETLRRLVMALKGV